MSDKKVAIGGACKCCNGFLRCRYCSGDTEFNEAEQSCIDIFNDYTLYEIEDYPPSVVQVLLLFHYRSAWLFLYIISG